MQVFVLISSVISDHLFPKDNIVLPTNGRAPQLCWGKTIYSWGTSPYMTDDIIFFFFFFMAVAGWRRFYYKYFYFYFFLWRCVTYHWGRVWGVNLFQTKWFIFLFFIFFMAVVAPHWGRVAWVKLKNKKIFYFFLFLAVVGWWRLYVFFFYFGGGHPSLGAWRRG